jgi:signal transduction histidine kinase
LAGEIRNTVHHSTLYLVCGKHFRDIDKLEESVVFFDKARYWALKNNQISMIEKIDYSLASNYSDIALMSNRKADFIVALKKIYRNIEFANKYHLLHGEVGNYSLLANFYGSYHNDSLGYKILEKVVNLLEKEELSDSYKLFVLISRFQLNLFYKHYAQANTNLYEILQLSDKTPTIYSYNVYAILVENYAEYGYFSEAIKLATAFHKNSKIMSVLLRREKFKLFCYLTASYLHKHNYYKAKQAYQKSIMYADYERNSELRILSKLRIRLLQNRKLLLEYERNFRGALQVANALESLQDSINSNQAVFELVASQERFDRKTKEDSLNQQIRLQKLENQFDERTLEQSKKNQWLSVKIIIILAVVILFITRQIKKIGKQANELKYLNDNQNKIFSIISHDLRSPVIGLQTFLSVMNDKSYSEKSIQAFSELKMQVSMVSNTLDNLLNWSITQMNGITPKIHRVNLQDCVEHIIELSDHIIQHKSITVLRNVANGYVDADESLTEVVIRNVLNNAIKFSEPKGTIRITLINRNDECVLQIQDYGVGMSAEQIKNLFHAYNSRKGTMGETGSGLGLKLSKDLMNRQGGEIEIESIVGLGTVVNIVFKKKLITI